VKRYRFSLETVLNVRRTEEQAARQKLAAANHDLRRRGAELVAETERYRRRSDALGLCELDSFRASRLDDEHAAGCLAAAHQGVKSATSAVGSRMAEWSDAATLVAALERLDEHRQGEWRTEVRRKEDAEVNDMVTARWSRPEGGLEI
jgi:flagellar biosynthesis chaperone FliJ